MLSVSTVQGNTWLKQDRIHTTPEKAENAALFLHVWLGILSTLIQNESRALLKSSSHRRNLKMLDRKHFKNGNFWNLTIIMNVISLTGFSSNTNCPKGPAQQYCCIFKFLRWTEKFHAFSERELCHNNLHYHLSHDVVTWDVDRDVWPLTTSLLQVMRLTDYMAPFVSCSGRLRRLAVSSQNIAIYISSDYIVRKTLIHLLSKCFFVSLLIFDGQERVSVLFGARVVHCYLISFWNDFLSLSSLNCYLSVFFALDMICLLWTSLLTFISLICYLGWFLFHSTQSVYLTPFPPNRSKALQQN